MFIINPYIYGAGAGPSYPVDDYSPTHAYSIRKLSSTATNAIRVRRSSDSAEQDIGFSGDDLDTSSLTTFVGANDGFVVKVYDQAGSNDLVQSTAANQAKIVSSGTVTTDPTNGVTAISYDGTNDYFNTTSNIGSTTDQTEVHVFNRGATGTFNVGVGTTGSTTPYAAFWYSDNKIYCGMWANSGKNFGTNTNTTDFLLFTHTTSASNTVDSYLNNSALTQVTAYSYAAGYNYNTVGRRGSQYADGYFQELMWWSTDESANRTDIQDNINTYYSIY